MSSIAVLMVGPPVSADLAVLMPASIGWPCDVAAVGEVGGTGAAARYVWVAAEAQTTREVVGKRLKDDATAVTPEGGSAIWNS